VGAKEAVATALLTVRLLTVVVSTPFVMRLALYEVVKVGDESGVDTVEVGVAVAKVMPKTMEACDVDNASVLSIAVLVHPKNWNLDTGMDKVAAAVDAHVVWYTVENCAQEMPPMN
jgi:cell division protein YceG involved in septum cleavage